MADSPITYSGPEWQDYVLNLLRIHYSTSLSIVPDTDRGDFGIEAFTTDGCAFQCYAPAEPLRTTQRYEKHRDKMTADLAKFCRNEVGLLGILGATKISTWVLMVPRHDSKEIMAHAATKTMEVRAKKLKHAKTDFRVLVNTADDFPKARDALAQTDIHKLAIPIDPQQVEVEALDWADKNDRLVETLDRKVARLSNARNQRKHRNWLLRRYVSGENILAETHRQFPTVHERIMTLKRTREVELEGLDLAGKLDPNTKFEKVQRQLFETFDKEVRTLDAGTLQTVTDGIVADWLLRCPLQFEDDE